MPATDPDISRPRLIRDASFLEADRNEIAQRRRAHNRLGFAYQIAFVRVLGRFPRQVPLEIDGEILRFTALQRRQTVSEHQQRIRDYLDLRPFDTTAGDQLDQFLEGEALRLDRFAALLARWARRKYKRFRRRERASMYWLGRIARRDPKLFVLWQLGVRPEAGE